MFFNSRRRPCLGLVPSIKAKYSRRFVFYFRSLLYFAKLGNLRAQRPCSLWA